jgi:hypothetical protein
MGRDREEGRHEIHGVDDRVDNAHHFASVNLL